MRYSGLWPHCIAVLAGMVRLRWFPLLGVLLMAVPASYSHAQSNKLSNTPTNTTNNTPTILVLGDSLSAEYGLQRGTGWVALLEQKLIAQKISATVVNASISGETTAGGASRLGSLLSRHKPSHVIIELGGNDALRGLSLTASQDNLTKMVQAAKASGAKVLLLGMQVPPNYGKDYSAQFARLYTQVSRAEKTGLVPFFLQGVADNIELFQPDRIHPNAQAQPQMLGNVWPELRKIL